MKTTNKGVASSNSVSAPQSTGQMLNSAQNDSVTFSLRGAHGDNILRLHDLAKSLDVVVASVFRHDLLMLQEILRGEEQSLKRVEREAFDECVRVLALSSLVRVEGPPNLSKITGYLIAADKPKLVDFIGRCTFLRVVLIVDRARWRASQT